MNNEERKIIPRALKNSFSGMISRIRSRTTNLQFSNAVKIFLRRKSSQFFNGGCPHPLRHLRRHQESAEPSHHDQKAATLDDIDRFLFDNFRSLYYDREDADHELGEDDLKFAAAIADSKRLFDSLRPAVDDLCETDRFFISPISSRSLMMEAFKQSDDVALKFAGRKIEDSGSSSTFPAVKFAGDEIDRAVSSSTVKAVKSVRRLRRGSSANSAEKSNVAIGKGKSITIEDCIAVETESMNPSEDFSRSMMVLIKSHARGGGMIDRDFMEELLFSYLSLNEKKNHKFVLGAFVDLVADLRRRLADDVGGGGEAVSGEAAREAKKRKDKIWNSMWEL